jgi:Protein of unknown function (DUF402)
MPQWLDPMTVVRDDAQSLVAWLPPGTVVLKTVLDTGEDVRTAPLLDRHSRKFSMAKTLWRGEGNLRIAPVGAPWSVWLFWEPGWQFAGWYINLESPIRHEGHHIYAEDQVLDVWVTPDHICHRKDEDELAAAVAQGRYSPQEAALITRKAGLAEEAVASWQSPFSDGWEDWRPDPDWKVPPLPDGVSWEFDLTPAHDPQPPSVQTA